jgi:hypothetical protein
MFIVFGKPFKAVIENLLQREVEPFKQEFMRRYPAKYYEIMGTEALSDEEYVALPPVDNVFVICE